MMRTISRFQKALATRIYHYDLMIDSINQNTQPEYFKFENSELLVSKLSEIRNTLIKAKNFDQTLISLSLGTITESIFNEVMKSEDYDLEQFSVSRTLDDVANYINNLQISCIYIADEVVESYRKLDDNEIYNEIFGRYSEEYNNVKAFKNNLLNQGAYSIQSVIYLIKFLNFNECNIAFQYSDEVDSPLRSSDFNFSNHVNLQGISKINLDDALVKSDHHTLSNSDKIVKILTELQYKFISDENGTFRADLSDPLIVADSDNELRTIIGQKVLTDKQFMIFMLSDPIKIEETK